MKIKRTFFPTALSFLLLLTGCGATPIVQPDAPETAETSAPPPPEQTDQVQEEQTFSETLSAETLPPETSFSETLSEQVTAAEVTEAVTSAETETEAIISTYVPETAVNVQQDAETITARLNEIFFPIRNTGASFAVKVICPDGGGNDIEASNCAYPMVSASLIKLYVAGTVYEQLDSVTAMETYAGETDYLLNIMISQSDNAACNTLVTRLGGGDPQAGMNAVNSYCQAHGFGSTQMNRLMLDFNGLENYTTVTDCCNILKSFYHSELAGSEDIIGFMKAQQTRTKIPAGITAPVVIANKTGELANVENDAAVIYADNRVYIISVMTNDLSDTEAARNAIAAASSAVFEYMN